MVCPKCGASLDDVGEHFAKAHPKAIGTAILKGSPTQTSDFVYVSPVLQTSGRQWNVIWMLGGVPAPALGVLKLDQWTVEWKHGTAPWEGATA